MSLSRIAALVGISFGSVFVFVNAGALPEPWPVMVRGWGLILVLAAVWFGVVRAGDAEAPPVDETSVRTYWVSVVAEVIAIPVGAFIISSVLDRPKITVLWVVFVVGAHFLPAKSFGIGRFAELGVVLMALAVVGAVVTLTVQTLAAPIAAVLAGMVMLAFSTSTGHRASLDRHEASAPAVGDRRPGAPGGDLP